MCNNNQPKLKHERHLINGNWYWVCPICGEWLAPHKMETPHGGEGAWRVLQSKGAASRHLMTHGKDLVQHGRNILDITRQGKTFCNSCGHRVNSKKFMNDHKCLLVSEKSQTLHWIPLDPNLKNYCIFCGEWLSASQVTKIPRRK